MELSRRPPDDPWDIVMERTTPGEEAIAVEIAKHLEKSYDTMKAALPSGTHFVVVIDVPSDSGEDDRSIAVSTSREHMAPIAIEWGQTVLARKVSSSWLPERSALGRQLCKEYFTALDTARAAEKPHPQNAGWDAVAELVLSDMRRLLTLMEVRKNG